MSTRVQLYQAHISPIGCVHSHSVTCRTELLRGPLFYVMVMTATTLVFWRQSPVGMMVIALMCGGDGLADIIGRKYGSAKLPFNRSKSWAGSLAMFSGQQMSSAVGILYFDNDDQTSHI